MKFATTFIRQYPPHLRHVATLRWEIKNSNFLHRYSDIFRLKLIVCASVMLGFGCVAKILRSLKNVLTIALLFVWRFARFILIFGV